MKKLKSLLKAILSQDMNLFKYKTKTTNNKKSILPIILPLIFMYAIGMYLNLLAKELSKLHLTYILLSITMLIPTILTLIEGIYKSQGILFENKDNDLLFSLPIKKTTIIAARLIKLYIFQYFYNLIFILPGYVIYIYYEHPGINFYIISVLMTLLIPIIPTIISSFIGFIIKKISVKFKSKKAMQMILTMIFFMIIMFLSLNTNNIIKNIALKATSINDMIMKIYYPIGAYLNLLQKFNIMTLLKLLIVTIIPLIIFILIISKYYFSIITKSNGSNISKSKNKEIKYKQNTHINTLIKKELKRYFSSTVYMFNTLSGLILMLIATIAMCININAVINVVLKGQELGISSKTIISLMPIIFYCLIIVISSLTQITSSSISIEGKSFNLTKCLPVSPKEIFLSKILSSNLISIPIILLSDIVFFIAFKPSILYIIITLITTIIMPTLIAIFGLIINLKYPKLDATSDAEVVKQSASSMVSIFGGLFISILLIMGLIILKNNTSWNIALISVTLLLIIITIILWNILIKYGTKKIKKINI